MARFANSDTSQGAGRGRMLECMPMHRQKGALPENQTKRLAWGDAQELAVN